MRSAMLAAVILFAAPVLADDKPTVIEFPTAGFKIAAGEGGKPTEPTVIKSAAELAKVPALKEHADVLAKQANFEKAKLVFFAWSGSGGDKITPDQKRPGTFVLERGKTRDLRQHVLLFSVPKDAEVKVVGK